MATLKIDAFPSDKRGQLLLRKVQDALSNLTGMRGGKNGVYVGAPTKLDRERDMLKPDYRIVWQQCTLEFDPEERGAEATPGTSNLKVGPFFLSADTSVMDMEKVILHEYLHLVIDIGWNATEAEHGQIHQIIEIRVRDLWFNHPKLRQVTSSLGFFRTECRPERVHLPQGHGCRFDVELPGLRQICLLIEVVNGK